ncbi:MAG: penicillin-binding protein [Blastocatellia bacterium]|jgi:penicillin-binding protein 1B|nr:penicillin-binding protein [Blastocatellia bacterium]
MPATRLKAFWQKRRRAILAVGAAFMLLIVAGLIFLVSSYRYYSKLVDARLAHGYLTSRTGIYAAPRTLRAGQRLSPDALVSLLRRSGYIETNASEVWSGSFVAAQGAVEIRPNKTSSSFPALVRVTFDAANHVAALDCEGITLDSFTLEPEALTNDLTMKTGKRTALSYGEIPPTLVQAILSIEDRRFFEHSGVDFFGVARALLRNAGDERMGQGGSTITQQLVKNTYLTPERTLRRKFAEAMLAFTIERRFSKQDIFALYCNEVYLGQRNGAGIRGVNQAARIYFGKDLKDLSLSESATIAGLIQSPTRYSPVHYGHAAQQRRNTVLGTMVRDSVITLDQAATAAREPLVISPATDAAGSLAPFFVDYVNRVAGESEDPAETRQTELPTFTTLEMDLQQAAETAVQRRLNDLKKVYEKRGVKPQAALVALDPKTGNVLAMVGGQNYNDSQLNRSTDARRQPGSVFKPFVYAAALESGMSPLMPFSDAPRAFSYDHKAVYRPANYGGAYSMRYVPMRAGLVNSLNVVTVDVATRVGLSYVADTAADFGLKRPAPYPALALGTTEVTPLEIAAAYATFANGGRRVQPRVIATTEERPGLTSDNSSVANLSGGADARIIRPETAYMITDMLADVIDHGTGRSARGLLQQTAVAGKTGTSRDGWFVGYTPNLVCAVWMGFDDNQQLGLTGAEAALPVWLEFMKSALEMRPELGGEAFARPAGIELLDIDPETGLLASAACPQRERVAITASLMPSAECYRHHRYFDFSESPERAMPAEFIEPQIASNSPASSKRRDSRTIEDIHSVLQKLRTTRVDENTRGRSVLVNDMRLNPPEWTR